MKREVKKEYEQLNIFGFLNELSIQDYKEEQKQEVTDKLPPKEIQVPEVVKVEFASDEVEKLLLELGFRKVRRDYYSQAFGNELLIVDYGGGTWNIQSKLSATPSEADVNELKKTYRKLMDWFANHNEPYEDFTQYILDDWLKEKGFRKDESGFIDCKYYLKELIIGLQWSVNSVTFADRGYTLKHRDDYTWVYSQYTEEERFNFPDYLEKKEIHQQFVKEYNELKSILERYYKYILKSVEELKEIE